MIASMSVCILLQQRGGKLGAQITGTSQSTVSRWERGELEPTREELSRIRAHARAYGIAWDDRWFFEPAVAEAGAASEGAAA